MSNLIFEKSTSRLTDIAQKWFCIYGYIRISVRKKIGTRFLIQHKLCSRANTAAIANPHFFWHPVYNLSRTLHLYIGSQSLNTRVISSLWSPSLIPHQYQESRENKINQNNVRISKKTWVPISSIISYDNFFLLFVIKLQ